MNIRNRPVQHPGKLMGKWKGRFEVAQSYASVGPLAMEKYMGCHLNLLRREHPYTADSAMRSVTDQRTKQGWYPARTYTLGVAGKATVIVSDFVERRMMW
jgi:hypothetical protein